MQVRRNRGLPDRPTPMLLDRVFKGRAYLTEFGWPRLS